MSKLQKTNINLQDTFLFNEKNTNKCSCLNRYYVHYKQNVCSDIIYKQNLKNIFEIPKINKIILNVTYKALTNDKKHIIPALVSLQLISGLKLKLTVADKSIANFKLRKNQIIGCKVNLRKAHMYSFFEKLITIILPRIRHFRGIDVNCFNQGSHLSLGLPEILIFPELENYFEFFQLLKGIDITIVINKKEKNLNFFKPHQFKQKPTKSLIRNSSLSSVALVFLSAFQFPVKTN